MKGLVFDIQHFCLHDGPGIRTVIFFKGCPLRCIWCCNPESHEMSPELMFDREKCIGCLKCLPCPEGALNPQVSVNRSLCKVCGRCEEVCPTNALRVVGRFLETGEVVGEVMKDAVFYGEEGGVTFSGGEPLMQDEFLLELSKSLKKEGLNLAMETSGYSDWSKLEKTLRYIDLFLFDLKAFDPKRHVECTGVSNERILENFFRIAKEGETVVRCVVVEGYNFVDEGDALKLAELCREAEIDRIDLLRYHRLGEKKYGMLGREYGLRVADSGMIYRIRDLLKGEGFVVSIGGSL